MSASRVRRRLKKILGSEATQKLLLILGIRRPLIIDLLLTAIGFVGAAGATLAVGPGLLSAAIGSPFLLGPLAFEYYWYYRRRKIYRARVSLPQVPLITVLASLAAAALNIYLLPVVLLNAVHIEDITPFIGYFDVVRIKRSARLLIEPIRRFELFVLLVSIFASSAVSYMLTHSPLVLIYPALSYGLLAYSVIMVPPEFTPETEEAEAEEGVTLLLARRLPFLYFLMRSYLMRPKTLTTARQAGLIGASYYTFVRKASGRFVLVTYSTLAASPILYALLKMVGMAPLSFVITALVPAVTFIWPSMQLSFMKSSRASKLSRNLLLIVSYLASMTAVAESLPRAMENLYYNRQLAKLFGLEKEAEIYTNLLKALGDESAATSMYVESIPDEFYRDTLRTYVDMVDTEGFGAAFNMLINRLREFTTRLVTSTASSFENIASNLISTVMLVETTLPIMAFMSSPYSLPLTMAMGGLMSAVIIAFITQTVMPDLPSEFINEKKRFTVGAMVLALTATAFTVVGRLLLPDLVTYLVPINGLVGVGAAFWYASLYDLNMNKDFLSKFEDLLDLFGTTLARTNSVERTLMELSGRPTFTERMRMEFLRLSNVLGAINVEKLEYKGVYWYKYFLFLASIAIKYGSAPRALYKAIADFALEFKRFMASVTSFGNSLLFLTIISQVVMTMETRIVIALQQTLAAANINAAVAQFGVSMPIVVLPMSQLSSLAALSYLSLIVTAVANGFALGKVMSGTFRDAKWMLILYVAQLAIIYIGVITNFGINFGATANATATPGAP